MPADLILSMSGFLIVTAKAIAFAFVAVVGLTLAALLMKKG